MIYYNPSRKNNFKEERPMSKKMTKEEKLKKLEELAGKLFEDELGDGSCEHYFEDNPKITEEEIKEAVEKRNRKKAKKKR